MRYSLILEHQIEASLRLIILLKVTQHTSEDLHLSFPGPLFINTDHTASILLQFEPCI